MEVNEVQLMEQLGSRDEAAFEQVFKTYFKTLHSYALSLLKEEATAEEMVQNVFFKLWERAEHLSLSGTVAAYLYRAVHNECMNYLKHRKVKATHQQYLAWSRKDNTDSASGKLSGKELENRLQQAINELPEQCRIIFQLSRFEELRYREIAEHLDLSVKTVENQMGKALKYLRAKLSPFLPAVILFINLLNTII
ncbi:MAG: RNA polymerase sigma-70 factor [Flavisolibacter sp.]|nr:RNA polymerase sigma-70 factor [Flavisolibacter sp.]